MNAAGNRIFGGYWVGEMNKRYLFLRYVFSFSHRQGKVNLDTNKPLRT